MYLLVITVSTHSVIIIIIIIQCLDINVRINY